VKKNLILLGMMGAGKSTLGKIVAKKQGLKFIDTDRNVEKNNGMKIDEIFNKKGEKFFREEEEKVVMESMQNENCVIALGGGAFINKTIRDHVLKKSISIWLDADLKILRERIRLNKKRPLLNVKNDKLKLSQLYNERKDIYKLADHKIDCSKLTKIDIVKKIIDFYEKF